MTYGRIYDNVNEAFYGVVEELLEKGKEIGPRGNLTLEIWPYAFTVTDVESNVLRSRVRKLNPYFLAAEALWILTGQEDPKLLIKYMPSIGKFYDDGNVTFGAYGPRWAAQVDFVVDALRRDRDTRQAVMTFWRPDIWQQGYGDQPHKFGRVATRDVPCTVALQFIIRNDRLHLSVYMRSNDIWKGFTYDFFTFTTLQKYVAALLGMKAGTYHHAVGSMHLYTTDHYAATRFIKEQDEVASMLKLPFDICYWGGYKLDDKRDLSVRFLAGKYMDVIRHDVRMDLTRVYEPLIPLFKIMLGKEGALAETRAVYGDNVIQLFEWHRGI